jgi:hypothetical protein
MRYRVYEPDTPDELPIELVQEWESDIAIEVGMAFERQDGEVWEVSSVEPDADPDYAGRIVLIRRS